jgi:hypothetical protein
MIQDMLTNIYTEFKNDAVISKNVGDRVKYYDYPENEDVNKTRLIIIPLEPPKSGTSGSDDTLSTNFSFQIDVQSPNRKICKEVQAAVAHVMVAFNFARTSGGLDEYFQETKMFVDARRYEGNTKLYNSNY